MKETIAQIAENIGTVLFAPLMLAWLIEAIAKENALAAALISPVFLLSVLLLAFMAADYFGWLDTL